jgi:hypothetical protein
MNSAQCLQMKCRNLVHRAEYGPRKWIILDGAVVEAPATMHIMPANLCYILSLASAIFYAALVVWGYVDREPGGPLLGCFAIWQLLPFAIAARMAYVCRNYPIACLIILAGTVLMEAMALFLLPRLLDAVHHEHVAVSRGARSCGPPAALIAMFFLAVLPLAQLLILGICGILAAIAKALSRAPAAPEQPCTAIRSLAR